MQTSEVVKGMVVNGRTLNGKTFAGTVESVKQGGRGAYVLVRVDKDTSYSVRPSMLEPATIAAAT